MSDRERPANGRSLRVRLYELGSVVPLVVVIAIHLRGDAGAFLEPMLPLWALSIAVVDLLPVPNSANLHFSLSFPLQLAVAILYPPAVAGAVALVGTSDPRELRGELPILKALFIRTEIAASVLAESYLFHMLGSVDSPWQQLAFGVVVATVAGYAINVVAVAVYARLASGTPLLQVVKDMHVGLFGEFLLSYMGLALFGVFVAIFFVHEGIWSIVVFVAPLAFARQMFYRTHSLQKATEELERKRQENEYQALHDALTGLPNRTLFLSRLTEAIQGAQPQGWGVGVMIMDLDEFKEINDTLGHHFGDLLLREIGPRLHSVVRDGDTVARLGGDEFGVVLPNVSNEGVAVQVAQRVMEELEQPLVLEGLALDVSASIGIAMFPEHSDDVDALLRRADVAMYAAKESHGGFEIYNPDRDQYSPDRLALLGQVRPAIEAEQFVLHYQPQVSMADGGVNRVEALVRWNHPHRGTILPDDFIHLVERTILLRPLTLWILNEALRQCREWRRAGLDLGVSVNLSVRNLLDHQLPEQIGNILRRWNLLPSALEVEITESSLMADSARSLEVLARLSAVGVGISIDDFGTGYSSLSYLKRLPVDEIKIDRSFVVNMGTNPNDENIVRATIDLSHNLGLRVVAEGVETVDAMQRLAALRCDLVQGFYLSQPVPAEELVDWLAARAHPHRSVVDGNGSGPGARVAEIVPLHHQRRRPPAILSDRLD